MSEGDFNHIQQMIFATVRGKSFCHCEREIFTTVRGKSFCHCEGDICNCERETGYCQREICCGCQRVISAIDNRWLLPLSEGDLLPL